MEKFETKTGEEGHIITGELATLFRVLSNPDTLKILFRTGIGIESSKYAIEELGLTQKRYYSRLRELIDTDLVKKIDGVYMQTALGRMVYERFLPTMGKAFDAREELELIVYLEGTDLENGVKKRILDDLDLPSFKESPKIKLLRDYEALAIEAIDLYDSAEESMLLASNYFDVRVIEAVLRAVDRGVICRIIVGKNSLSSKTQRLRMMLSITFTKAIIDFTSRKVKMSDFVKFVDLPYTFGVMDGKHSILDVYNRIDDNLIVGLSLDDKHVSEKLTKFFDVLWNVGEHQTATKILDSLKSS